MSLSEIMTIMVYFHASHYRDSSTITPSMWRSICALISRT
jgi:hypothetical protein